ncbi:MAG: gliding motility-associated C-terminal domain-containing protein [Bacteroidia bacterium]|nr:gliding motility-associated C-terminal domain-containing protein [Bacteroidia bacterium]
MNMYLKYISTHARIGFFIRATEQIHRSIKKSFLISVLFLCSSFYSASLSAQECNIIYVTPTGVSSGTTGTKNNPASLAYGLTLVSSTNNLLWLSTGTYLISNILSIPSNATIEGGFDASTWIKSTVSQSIIDRDATNPLPSPFNALVGLAGNAASNFRLQDLTINIANAPGNQISVYGIYLSGCSNYNITRCTVTTGAGSAGLAGIPGTAGAAGGNGGAGTAGGPQTPAPGGTGGTGANAGGNGATVTDYENVSSGSVGLGPSGGLGGAGGTGPSCSLGCFSGPPSCSSTTPGQPGQVGGVGAIGTIGITGPAGSIIGGYFTAGGAGGNGSNGSDGSGGGGGGGGGGRQENGTDQWGGSGGGGGGGGFGSIGGIGGTGGGGSFALFLFNNGAGGIVQDCFLNPGAAGPGGIGGLGGLGGNGGNGGAGGAAGVCSNGVGGAGGNGGTGGQGGSGGAGADGMSVALSENGGTPVSSLGITAVPGNPPDISVTNKGCTNSEVIFSSTTSGTWTFGAGSSPATATGAGPFSVYYSTMGRKSVAFSGTTFTDYVTIFQAGPATPSISPANGSVTLGCPNTFNTSLTGTYYQWIFGNSATPDTLEGASMQTASNIYFGAAGTYTIYVYVTTACCGKVRDSTSVTVNPSSFDVTLTASPSSSCEGDPITFTASPNTYLGYAFYVNAASVQSGPSDTYTTSTLSLGDSVVVVALAGTCFTNPSAVILPVITPFPVVSLISSDPDSTICEGTSVLFIAMPIGYTSYEFFDAGVSVQNSASISYTTTTLLPGNSITVVATNLGCASLPSAAKVTTVNLAPQIILTSSDADNILCGTGQSITFTASPAGFTNYDFLNNGSNIQTGATNTYTTTTLANGSSIEVIATSSSGCVGQTSNAIVTAVNPIPNAWLGSSDPDNTICQNELITFTSIPAGYTSYDFFNAGVSVQNGAANTYVTTLNSGNSITVVATNLGCPSPLSNAITVTIIPADPVNGGNDFSACINAASIALIGATPTNGTWTGPGITNPAGLFDPPTAGVGNHKLVYAFTNTSGCTGYDTIFASVNPLPVVTTSPASPTVCEGFSTNLTATGANSYVWSPSTGLSSSTGSTVAASPIVTTTYTIVGTSNNCSDSTTTTVTVFLVPTVSISGITTIGSCESTVLTALPSVTGTFSWGPLVNLVCNTCESATVSPTSTQDYYVTLTSPDGCYDTDSVTVDIVNVYNYFMPTGFTPNSDGINDSLHVHGRGIESISLKIFDRIGEKVFESLDILVGWDGKLNEVPMNDGVFVYLLEVKYCNGETVKEQGSLTLVR